MRSRSIVDVTTAPSYPASFAQPLQQGYALGLDRGTVETKMRSGWTRKRRLEPYTQRSLSLSFKMSVLELEAWHDFVNRNAYSWFSMPLQTDLSAPTVEPYVRSEYIRFTSGVSFQYSDYATVVCTVDAEVYIDPTNANLPTVPARPPAIDDPGSGVTPPGDGDGASDPAGTIDLTNPPGQYRVILQNTTVFSQAFRTTPSDEAFGRLTVALESASSSNTFRVWISQTAGGGYLGYADGTGNNVSHSWAQGLTVGPMTKLNGDTRYFFNIQLINANPMGEFLLVELY